MSTHEQIMAHYQTYLSEQEAFETKGVKAAYSEQEKH